MKAVWFQEGQASIRELPIPKRAPGESLLRLRVAGICNTDLELKKGYMGFAGTPGHEFTAEVMESHRPELVGQRVVGEINIPCGKCRLCHEGLGRHCPTREVLGIAGRAGCLAEFFVLPDANLHVLPATLQDFDAVLTEPLAAALRIPEQVKLHDHVLVVGDGKLGLLTAVALRRQGSRVWLAGHHDDHFEMIRRLGVYRDHGGTYSMVVDCTGNPEALDDILHRLEPQGTLVMKSTTWAPPTFDLSRFVVQELTMVGSRCGPFAPALELLQNQEIAETLADTRQTVFPFARVLDALEEAARPGVLKVLVDNLQ